jgi:protease-4
VDKLGSLEDAIESAARKAGLEKYGIDYLQQPLTRRERLLKQFNELFGGLIRSAVERVAPTPPAALKWVSESLADDIMKLNDPNGIYAYCVNCRVF